jgi:hypothetical protein
MTFQSPPPHGRSNSDSSNALTTPYAARPRKRTAHAVSELDLRVIFLKLLTKDSVTLVA